MVGLAQILQHLYPSSEGLRDWVVTDDGSGERITYWSASLGPQPTSQEIVEAELPALKQVVIRRNQKEAARRILAKWPSWVQSNCLLGIYPEAIAAQCAADIAAVIQAENTAADAINAATTVAEVEAVTATWPTL